MNERRRRAIGTTIALGAVVALTTACGGAATGDQRCIDHANGTVCVATNALSGPAECTLADADLVTCHATVVDAKRVLDHAVKQRIDYRVLQPRGTMIDRAALQTLKYHAGRPTALFVSMPGSCSICVPGGDAAQREACEQCAERLLAPFAHAAH